jgi:hypothetical protein
VEEGGLYPFAGGCKSWFWHDKVGHLLLNFPVSKREANE